MALPELLCVCAALITLVISQTTSLTYNAASRSSLASVLSSECVALITLSSATVSSWASTICEVCQGLSVTPSLEPCCAAANPTACFASSFYGITVSDASQTATFSFPGASKDCDSAISIFSSCQAVTPGFPNLCFHDQQSCYCSTSGTYAPSYFDNYYSNCLAYLSSAFPSSYSQIALTADGTVQSRKCQTFFDLTKTGGTPSNCMTSAAASLSSPSSLASAAHASPTSISSGGGNKALKSEVSGQT